MFLWQGCNKTVAFIYWECESAILPKNNLAILAKIKMHIYFVGEISFLGLQSIITLTPIDVYMYRQVDKVFDIFSQHCLKLKQKGIHYVHMLRKNLKGCTKKLLRIVNKGRKVKPIERKISSRNMKLHFSIYKIIKFVKQE